MDTGTMTYGNERRERKSCSKIGREQEAQKERE